MHDVLAAGAVLGRRQVVPFRAFQTLYLAAVQAETPNLGAYLAGSRAGLQVIAQGAGGADSGAVAALAGELANHAGTTIGGHAREVKVETSQA